MAWTLTIDPLVDFGKYYSAAFVPASGSVFSPPNPGGGGAPLDTVTSAAPTFLALSFSSAAVPPSGAGTVLVTDSVTSGDLVRSGTIASFPPSPATAPLVTFPPALISSAALAASVAAEAARQGAAFGPTRVPNEIRVVSGLLTLGMSIPLLISVGPPTTALGNGTVTVTVPVFLVARVGYFFVRTYDLTLTLTYAPAPSHDPAVPSRVLTIGLSGQTLSGPMRGLPLGHLVSTLISGVLEAAVNEIIVSTARAEMAKVGFRPTTSAVFSARNVTITTSGMNLQLVLSDLSGPGMVPIPGALAVAIVPTPAAGVQRTYTVTVTNSATGAPVPGATVTLENPDASGVIRTVTATTNAAGQATLGNVTLRVKTTVTRTVAIDIEGKLRDVEGQPQVTAPMLAVAATGFSSVTMALL